MLGGDINEAFDKFDADGSGQVHQDLRCQSRK